MSRFNYLWRFLLIVIVGACSTRSQIVLTTTPQSTIFPSSTIISSSSGTTGTPISTFSPTEASSRLQDLLKTNAGCRLPCWWGITPGKTTWDEAEEYLKTFTALSTTQGSNELFAINAYLPLSKEKGTLSHTYYIKNNIVIGIDAFVYDWMPLLYLSNFLTEYGPPDEAFVRTFRYDENGSQPYQIDLFYGKLGVLLEYSGGTPNTVGEKIQNCFDNLYSPFIYIWSSDTPMTSREAIDALLNTQSMPYPIPLDEATGMDVITFYEAFKSPNSTTCLETPAELWP